MTRQTMIFDKKTWDIVKHARPAATDLEDDPECLLVGRQCKVLRLKISFKGKLVSVRSEFVVLVHTCGLTLCEFSHALRLT